MGGLIYFSLLGIVALVLINFLPVVNFVFQLLFDGCVACSDSLSEKSIPKRLRRPKSISKAPTQRIKGNAKGKATGASASATSSTTDADINNVHLTAQQLRSIKRTRDAQDGVEVTDSFGQRLRSMGQRMVSMGEAPPPLYESTCLMADEEHNELNPHAWA